MVKFALFAFTVSISRRESGSTSLSKLTDRYRFWRDANRQSKSVKFARRYEDDLRIKHLIEENKRNLEKHIYF